ncbi:MAG: ATP-grasp domain-containing protein [Euryarchaeota archaeon]|nr:ATP-grasp domain-containing protein [Euryarchaeota archaeon]
MHEIHRILAVGYSVRHIVCSGSRAGYEMYAADAFGDVDTKRCAKRYFPLDPLQLHAEIKNLKEEIDRVDGLIIGSGFENADFSFLKEADRRKILGNVPDKTKEVSNKAWLSSRLDDLGIPHPLTYTGREIAERIERAEHFRYPVVAKPAYGGGGTANFLCRTERELIRWAAQLPDFLYQGYIKGQHASVSTISTKRAAMSVCLNEQLIGVDSLFAPGLFVYCGNISPFVTKFSDGTCEIAEELTSELGLIGSNGVDFVITDDSSFVIEVNARLQGSLDTVERSTGLNMVDAHMKAVRGELPERGVAAKRYAVKAIVFAKHEGVVMENLDLVSNKEGIVDIPEKGRIVKPGEPIATGIGLGDSREEAVADAMSNVERIKASVR